MSTTTTTMSMSVGDDVAAPLDALLAEAALGPIRRFAPDLSTARLVASLASRPAGTARRFGSLASGLAQIAIGTSSITPSRRDRRFADEAWRTNPVLRRVVQAYLAAGQTAERLVGDAELDWRDDQRVRFLVQNLVEALAPSNLLLLNPASAKAVVDTGGLNVVRGARAFVKDMASAPRIPEMVDPTPFELGRNIAATTGAVVLRTEVFELIRYIPQTPQVRAVPLLFVPPTINKFYAIDLAPGRSLVEHMVGQGQQVFVMSWRNPQAVHADWNTDTYVSAILQAMDAAERLTGAERGRAMENRLVRPGAQTALGVPVDLSQVTVDAYVVAGNADHLTPWQNCYSSTQLLGGTTRFVLSTSGHIAALVNPPEKPKATFQTGKDNPADPQTWLRAAESRDGSWWPDFDAWLAERCGTLVEAPSRLGGHGLEPLGEAPGTYVLET